MWSHLDLVFNSAMLHNMMAVVSQAVMHSPLLNSAAVAVVLDQEVPMHPLRINPL